MIEKEVSDKFAAKDLGYADGAAADSMMHYIAQNRGVRGSAGSAKLNDGSSIIVHDGSHNGADFNDYAVVSEKGDFILVQVTNSGKDKDDLKISSGSVKDFSKAQSFHSDVPAGFEHKEIVGALRKKSPEFAAFFEDHFPGNAPDMIQMLNGRQRRNRLQEQNKDKAFLNGILNKFNTGR